MKRNTYITGKKRQREIEKVLKNKKRKLVNLKFPLLPKHPTKVLLPTVSTFPELKGEDSFLTEQKFDSLPLHPLLTKKLVENGYSHLTPIQYSSIPHLMLGKDICAEAPTGTGKTLSFLVPIIDRALRLSFLPEHGLCGLVLCPTRELALQIFNEAMRLTNETGLSVALLTGGGNKFKESKFLCNKGVNIAIGTPGRVLDHLINTDFNRRNIQFLVLDEADRMVSHGFGTDIKAILYKFFKKPKLEEKKKKKKLKKKTQTEVAGFYLPFEYGEFQRCLFSATMGDEIVEISKRLLQMDNVVNIKSSTGTELSVSSQVSHGYVEVSESDKFLLLMTFLRAQKNKKIIVFFSTCLSAKYFSQMMFQLNPGFRKMVMVLHGEMNQKDRTRVFRSFKDTSTSTSTGQGDGKGKVLFSTNLCSRGMDIGDISWIVQYDVPNDLRDYVHRVGRTGRAGQVGQAVLFLTKTELAVLEKFEEIGISVKKQELGSTKLLNVQTSVEGVLENNYKMLSLAHKAFQVKIYAYKSYPFKDIFSVQKLDVDGLAKQYGLKKVPYVALEERSDDM